MQPPVKFFWVWTLLFCCPHARAQALLNVDSLIKISQRYEQEDTQKIRALVQFAAACTQKEATQGINSTKQALRIAQNLNERHWEARACFELCRLCHAVSNNPEAMTYCDKAMAVFETLNDKKGVADCTYLKGDVYKELGDNPNALVQFEKATHFYGLLGDKARVAASLQGVGGIYQVLGNYTEALAYHQKALAMNTNLNNPTELAANFMAIAFAHKSLSDLPKALTYYQKALRIFEAANNEAMLAHVFDKIGSVYRDLEDFPKSIEYYERAIVFNERVANKRRLGITYGNLGGLYGMQGDYPKAILYHEKALAIFEPIGFKYGISATYTNIGEVYLKVPNYEKTLLYYKKALALSREMGIKQHQASSLLGIGTAYLYLPDNGLTQESIPLSNRFPKAFEMLQSALTLAQEIGNKELYRDVWQTLSNAYEKSGNYVKAYEAFKNYVLFRDSVNGDAVKNQVFRKEVQYEFEKKEAVLKVEQQLTVEQLDKQRLLSQQQQQTLRLKEQALVISDKEKDLQRLAFLREQSDKQEKEQLLGLAEKDKQLQAADIKSLVQEKALQVQTLAEKNALNALLLASLVVILLSFTIFTLWQRQEQTQRARESQVQFTQQLLQNIEEERGRIARDLHDGISPELITLKRTLSEQTTATSAQRIDRIINDIRQISRNLHPVMLQSIGLKIGLESLCEQFGQNERLFVSHDIDYPKTLSPNAELQLFRIVQEALTNALKYANAEAANVHIVSENKTLKIEIKDNGKGFDVPNTLNGSKAFGLHSILQRSKVIGGEATIHSTEKGTTIKIIVPITNNQ